jgi:hypothetical protein
VPRDRVDLRIRRRGSLRHARFGEREQQPVHAPEVAVVDDEFESRCFSSRTEDVPRLRIDVDRQRQRLGERDLDRANAVFRAEVFERSAFNREEHRQFEPCRLQLHTIKVAAGNFCPVTRSVVAVDDPHLGVRRIGDLHVQLARPLPGARQFPVTFAHQRHDRACLAQRRHLRPRRLPAVLLHHIGDDVVERLRVRAGGDEKRGKEREFSHVWIVPRGIDSQCGDVYGPAA